MEQYFRRRYNILLNYPTLPAIQAGSDKKPVFLPMEVCLFKSTSTTLFTTLGFVDAYNGFFAQVCRIVPGQRYTKKLNERQVTALLRATCQRPADRENSIMGVLMTYYFDYNICFSIL